MARKKVTREENVDHPLENLFGIQPLSTVVSVVESESDLIDHSAFDDKDKEIEKQFESITNLALDGYDAMVSDIEQIEPKYRARSNEVAIQYLNAAMNAVREKAALKKHKDQLRAKPGMKELPTQTTNNVFIGDRNDVMRMLRERRSGKTIDHED